MGDVLGIVFVGGWFDQSSIFSGTFVVLGLLKYCLFISRLVLVAGSSLLRIFISVYNEAKLTGHDQNPPRVVFHLGNTRGTALYGKLFSLARPKGFSTGLVHFPPSLYAFSVSIMIFWLMFNGSRCPERFTGRQEVKCSIGRKGPFSATCKNGQRSLINQRRN